MNSTAADVFGSKCCAVRFEDTNLEIHVTNRADRPVTVPSRCELEGSFGTRVIDNLMPHGEQTIPPGETIAFYCYLDEAVWDQATALVMTDSAGAPVRAALPPADVS